MTRLLELGIGLCVLLTCSALVALMAVFIGFEGPGVDRLLAVQTRALVPVALFVVWPLSWFVLRYGNRAPAMIWRFVPAWLLFAWLLINLLTFFGEVSHIMVRSMANRSAPFIEHLPLLTGALGSLGACLGVAMHGALHVSDVNGATGPDSISGDDDR